MIGGNGKRGESAFFRVLEDRRAAARRQPAPEETNEREPEAETPLSRFLLRRRPRRPWR